MVGWSVEGNGNECVYRFCVCGKSTHKQTLQSAGFLWSCRWNNICFYKTTRRKTRTNNFTTALLCTVYICSYSPDQEYFSNLHLFKEYNQTEPNVFTLIGFVIILLFKEIFLNEYMHLRNFNLFRCLFLCFSFMWEFCSTILFTHINNWFFRNIVKYSFPIPSSMNVFYSTQLWFWFPRPNPSTFYLELALPGILKCLIS